MHLLRIKNSDGQMTNTSVHVLRTACTSATGYTQTIRTSIDHIRKAFIPTVLEDTHVSLFSAGRENHIKGTEGVVIMMQY